MRFVVLILLMSLPLSARAVVSEDALPNQAQWISVSGEEHPARLAFFHRTFEIGAKVVKAVLLAAADQHAAIRLNGSPAVEVSGFARAVSADVTPFIRAGTNALAVRVATESSLPAFRL